RLAWNPKKLKAFFKKEGIHKANVSVRGAAITPDEVYKLLDLKTGGDTFIFIAKMKTGTQLYLCEKITF
ncbi:MAG: hypothetical protein H7321_03045, partial [Bacteroidia bacterium]|nr:hypothetical protein [Bacteroidia bacterium]